jgi:hypothetical protein
MRRFIAKQDGDYHNCTFPYNLELVNFIKSAAPRRLRWWNPPEHYWTIHTDYLRPVLEQARYMGFTVSVQPSAGHVGGADYDDPPPRTTTSSGDATADFAHFLSFDALHKAYRQACLECHPDRPGGGDPEAMKRLNNIWDQIKKKFDK